MSVRLVENLIRLEGNCRVEDAEPLLQALQQDPARIVDLSGAEGLHTAVVQILLALRPAIGTGSRDAFLSTWVEPLLTAAQVGNMVVDLPKRLDRTN